MSVAPLNCEPCGTIGVFAQASRFPQEGDETSYGVGWRCPTCMGLSLDLCPVGPIEPAPGDCLNCGEHLGEGRCAGCGDSADNIAGFLGVGVGDGTRTLVDAVDAFEAGLFRQGFAVANQILQRDPSNRDAWLEKARALQGLALDRAAIRCYRRATALAPDPQLEIAVACSLSDLGEMEEAIAIYDVLIATCDGEDLAIAHANRGNARASRGDTKGAAEDFDAAIVREPKRLLHYLNYAVMYSKQKRWNDAGAVIDRAIAAVSSEEKLPLFIERARLHNEQEQAEEGLAAADAALAIAAEHPRGLYQRGWALGMLGRLEESRDVMVRLVELEPTNVQARAALAKVEAALPALPPPAAHKPWWKFWGS